MCAPRHYLFLLLASLPLALAAGTARLEVDADRARALVQPATAGSKLLQLPSLDYLIDIEARCQDSKLAESLSISVADTRMTLRRDDIAGKTNLTVEFTVPASQVAPLAAENFCLTEDRDGEELQIEDAFTAHLSLRCSGESGESIIYASRPLAVTLVCARQTQGESEASILR